MVAWCGPNALLVSLFIVVICLEESQAYRIGLHSFHSSTSFQETTTKPSPLLSKRPRYFSQPVSNPRFPGAAVLSTPLRSSVTGDDASISSPKPPPKLIARASVVLRRLSWISWWSQVILTVISSVTLAFASSVLSSAGSSAVGLQGGNFFFAGSGLVLAAASIFWTWGVARLSDRLLRPDTTRITAANMMRRAIKVGTMINLLGMLLTILGAERIVGVLAVKVLTMQGVSPFASGGASAAVVATQTLQPLDILIVQGNTNALFSHFISLCCILRLVKWVEKLDPPSTEDATKKKSKKNR